MIILTKYFDSPVLFYWFPIESVIMLAVHYFQLVKLFIFHILLIIVNISPLLLAVSTGFDISRFYVLRVQC